ncbi:MAG: amidohydrolase [Candidatus Methanofastidiosia archaeon]
MLIKGGTVYRNGKFLKTDIEITDGIIARIAKDIKNNSFFNARDMIIIPGFVNTHTHLAMTLLRGAGDDMPLHKWLSERIWPLEKNLTYKDCYWGSMLGIVEMIKTGTTCFNDMYFHMDATVQAVKDYGIRASVTHAMIDGGDSSKAADEFREARRIQKMCEKEERLTYMMGPHAPYTCSKDFLENIKDFATQHDLRTHIHLSETKKEVEDMKKEQDRTPVEYLDSINFLDDMTVLAHCVHLTEKDTELIAHRSASVLHCPQSNMKLSSGIANVPEMLEKDINVSLGTDGAASNNSLDMQQEMKAMALVHKLKNPTNLPAPMSFDIATQNGGKALGLKIGKIEEGYMADIIFIDREHYSMQPCHDIMSNIVYSMKPDAISCVMVGGDFLMREKELVGIDEKHVYKKASKHAHHLVETVE